MPFFTDTDGDNAGWDNALDKAVLTGGGLAGIAGAGLMGIGGVIAAIGSGETATGVAAPLGIPTAVLGAGIAGVGGMIGAGGAAAAGMAQMGIWGDAAQQGIGLAGMVGNGIAGVAESAHDFVFPPPLMAPGTPPAPGG